MDIVNKSTEFFQFHLQDGFGVCIQISLERPSPMDPVVNHEEENQDLVEDRQVCSWCYCSEQVGKYQE